MKSDFITKVRQASSKLIEAVNDLKSLDGERVCLDYDTNLKTEDFVGENETTEKGDILSALYEAKNIDLTTFYKVRA